MCTVALCWLSMQLFRRCSYSTAILVQFYYSPNWYIITCFVLMCGQIPFKQTIWIYFPVFLRLLTSASSVQFSAPNIYVRVCCYRYLCIYCRTQSDYSLERTLAMNYSYEVSIVTRTSVSPYVYLTNNTRVIRMAVVANDPADFSRNSYSQRTLNDLLESDGRTSSRIDLLRLLSSDRDVSQMWEFLRYLINDGVLLHVQQLHLLVNIGESQDGLRVNVRYRVESHWQSLTLVFVLRSALGST